MSSLKTRIKLLPPIVAERIAAGEVIERPASVVKELVENSLDAGATAIQVNLRAAGKELIEVIDNGSGMSQEDLELATQRHATSKLQSFEDLETLSTLGFRGEALPSISAVSTLSILSRPAEGTMFQKDASQEIHSNSFTAYELLAGQILQFSKPQKTTFGLFLGSSHGTRVQVHGLFSQVPARLKFLKSNANEIAAIREGIERVAIAYPSVGFQLFNNDRLVLKLLPADEKTRVRTLLSSESALPLVTTSDSIVYFEDYSLTATLYWLQGLSLSHTKGLMQVLNLRPPERPDASKRFTFTF